MAVSREEGRAVNLVLNAQQVAQAVTFTYLGAVTAEKGTCGRRGKSKNCNGKSSLQQIKRTLTKDLKKDLKKRMAKTVAGSVVCL
jgi:hypothetical protein